MDIKEAEYQDGMLTIENLEFIQEMDLLHCNVGLQTHDDGRIWVCVNGAAFLRFKAMEIPTGTCSICEQEKKLPFTTPDDPPFYAGGRHCQECETWLLTGED